MRHFVFGILSTAVVGFIMLLALVSLASRGDGGIDGYADRVSYGPGETATFFLSGGG